jgi:hypothetical protein
MSPIAKHEPSKTTKGKKNTRLTLADGADSSALVNVSSIADAIDGFASIFSTYVTQARNGDNGSGLYTTPTGYPVKAVLTSLDGEDEAVHCIELELAGSVAHSIADSLKRIADAMTARAEHGTISTNDVQMLLDEGS